MRTKGALGVLTGMVLSGSAVAFEQCPEGMHVCATVLQVLGYGVLPSLLFWLLVAFVARRIRATWLRVVTVAVSFVLWCFSITVLWWALMAFLAPCTTGCWYGFRS